ncbi:MAG: radical SAM protein [Defluviitaleaceae bacterium]|nr:radical SAM protein [Defluviitaleaceae bacterium]MCL2274117.1 radical SAM protein [Defluviitaleaceae bacterium]
MFTFVKLNGLLHLVDSLHGGRWEVSYEFAENYLYYLKGKSIDAGKNLLADSRKLNSDWLIETKNIIEKHALPTHFSYHIPTIIDNLMKSKDLRADIITPPLPIIEVGRECNYKCLWCYNDSATVQLKHSKIYDFNTEIMMEKIISPLIDMGQTEFCLTGGEPSLYLKEVERVTSHIVNKVSKLSAKPCIWLLTNGYKLYENAERYMKCGISKFQVSLSSPLKEKDNYLRKPPQNTDSFGECINGIKKIRHLSDKAVIEVNMIVQPESYFGKWSNIHDINQMYDLAQSLGVNTLRIIPAVPSGEAKKNSINFSLPEYSKISEYVSLLKDRSKAEKSGVLIDCPLGHDMNGKAHDCRASYMYIYVNAFGYVYPCNNLQEDSNLCWDKPISKNSSFDIVDIWKNSKLLHYFRTNNDLCEECTKCKNRPECIGQCRALTYHRHGEYSLSSVPETCLLKHF